MLERIEQNLADVKGRINDAAEAVGRDPSSITLIAVTKYVDADMTRMMFEAGCSCLGESRPQVLWDKASALDGVGIQWHMIGHLQRNKVKRTIGVTSLIHSVDSLRLLNAIDEAAENPVRVLLEINVSGEQAKHGFEASELAGVLEHASQKENVIVDGLMCMAGLMGDQDDARREFEMLRTIRDDHREYAAPNINLTELSMGMSGDFELAIAEGATLVRVGSSLFEGIRD